MGRGTRAARPQVCYDAVPARGVARAAAIRMDSSKHNRLFQQGLEAFNSRHFFEAHEHWEEVWLETPNPEKKFLQGLIQVAAAFHHHSRANDLGCRKLLRGGLLKLDLCPEEFRGIAIEPLRASVRRLLAVLEAGENPDQEEIPRIQSAKCGQSST